MDYWAILDLVIDINWYCFGGAKPGILAIIFRSLYLSYVFIHEFDEIGLILKGIWLCLLYTDDNWGDYFLFGIPVIGVIYFLTLLLQLRKIDIYQKLI